MAETKTVAAEGSKRKGQKTRAELIKDNDALQMILSEQAEEIESLKASREAWVRKCEELTGRAEELEQSNEALQDVSREYLQNYFDLRDHPWKNLLRPIKAVLGIG